MDKHGLSQYRINLAKNHAQGILESINKIDVLFNGSLEKVIDESLVDSYISRVIKEIERNKDLMMGYLEQENEK